MKTLFSVFRPCLVAGVTALLVAAPAMAQTTGTVTGAVVDATSGRILSRTLVLHVIINGNEVSLDNKHKELWEKYRARR